MTGGTWRYSDRLRFHIRLVDRVSAIGTFDHHLSLMQTSLNITHLQRRRLADILRTPLFFDLRSLLRDGSMLTSSCNYSCLATRANQRRIRPYSSLRINNGRQRLVIDLHNGGSILGACLCLAYHNSYRMPAPYHFAHCQWGLRTGERICLGHCQRFGGKNSYDSRHSQSRRCINIQNACMGIRAEDQTRIQHSWQYLVSRIARTPGYFVRSILSRERRANQNRLRCLHHRKISPADLEGGGKPHQRRGRGQAPPLLYYWHLSENVFCIFSLEIVLQSEQQHEGNIATILIKRTCIHIRHARLESCQVTVQHSGNCITIRD